MCAATAEMELTMRANASGIRRLERQKVLVYGSIYDTVEMV